MLLFHLFYCYLLPLWWNKNDYYRSLVNMLSFKFFMDSICNNKPVSSVLAVTFLQRLATLPLWSTPVISDTTHSVPSSHYPLMPQSRNSWMYISVCILTMSTMLMSVNFKTYVDTADNKIKSIQHAWALHAIQVDELMTRMDSRLVVYEHQAVVELMCCSQDLMLSAN